MISLVALAVECGLLIEAPVLQAIVQVESGGNPYALAVNGPFELVRAPRTRDEAVAMARWLDEHGYNFDAGLAQVNSANFARLGLDVVSAFDPCANLRAASEVLGECHQRALARVGEGERAVTAALSCYNTGHFTRGVRNGYVAAVSACATGPLRLVARGRRNGAAATGDPSTARSSRQERVGRSLLERARRESAWMKRRVEAFASSIADAFGARPARASRAEAHTVRTDSGAGRRQP